MYERDRARRRRRWRRRLILAVMLGAALWAARTYRAARIGEGSVLLLDLEGAYADSVSEDMLGGWLGGGSLGVLDLVRLIGDAREDARVAGVVVRIRPLRIGWAKAQEIRDALLSFRAAGKPLVAYLENEFAGSTREYYVASAAPKVYLPPGGNAPLAGLRVDAFFLGGLWEKLDIDMQVEKVGEYKSFGEMIADKEMSAPHREMTNALLDSLYEQVVAGIADARGLEPGVVRGAVDRAPATAEEFAQLGLADGAKFLDDIRAEVLDGERDFVTTEDYVTDRRQARRRGGPKIAVVCGGGAIHAGDGSGRGWETASIGADTMADTLRDAARDKTVKAIVFRVDSPGGSAMASDLIWRAVREAGRVKPLVVSMSDVAASGGYYVAAGASRILAQPGTLTGSIGVVMAKPNVAGMLAKLGVGSETLARGEMARMNSLVHSLGPAERSRVTAVMTQVYQLFVRRVSEGRNLSVGEVDAIGRGRVWTGAQALANGLVDELGGWTAAVEAAKAAAGIPKGDEVELVFYAGRKGVVERIRQWIGVWVAGARPEWWSYVSERLTAFEFPDGSVLTLMPEMIDIR